MDLTTLRKARGFTQTDLSVYLGVSPAMVSMIETGKRYPSFLVSCRIERLFGVPCSELFNQKH